MSTINAIDLELKRAFTDMQVNKIETTKKLKMLDIQAEMLKTSKKKYEITDKEVKNLTPDTRVYSSVGRMFVLSSLPEVHTELLSKQGKCDDILKSLDDKKEFLLKCSKEQEDSLRELVQQRKEATSN
ncbi:prefoldin subunit 1 [Sitodiplosis mosellana]|uniref:prefoldin subunit 1 n=1 Tax=Sitodiplosis mosellana TaxID=263140 RepID=UPI002445158E|nr:prefoldin subunit 1 [Sitodiplosis mosellana]